MYKKDIGYILEQNQFLLGSSEKALLSWLIKLLNGIVSLLKLCRSIGLERLKLLSYSNDCVQCDSKRLRSTRRATDRAGMIDFESRLVQKD